MDAFWTPPPPVHYDFYHTSATSSSAAIPQFIAYHPTHDDYENHRQQWSHVAPRAEPWMVMDDGRVAHEIGNGCEQREHERHQQLEQLKQQQHTVFGGKMRENTRKITTTTTTTMADFEWMKVKKSGRDSADKKPTLFTVHQSLELEKEYLTNRYVKSAQKTAIATRLGLSEQQVKTWFQNRRQKEKKMRKDSGEAHRIGMSSSPE